MIRAFVATLVRMAPVAVATTWFLLQFPDMENPHSYKTILSRVIFSHNISLFDIRYNAIVSTGIRIVNRVEIPANLVPDDAKVEITAKVFHGYNAGKAYQGINEEELKKTKGREYNYNGEEETEQVEPDKYQNGNSIKAEENVMQAPVKA